MSRVGVILWLVVGAAAGLAAWAGVDASIAHCETVGQSIRCDMENMLSVTAGIVVGGFVTVIGIARSGAEARTSELREDREARPDPLGGKEERDA